MSGGSKDHAADSTIVATSVSTFGLTNGPDSDYTILSTDRIVQISTTLTLPRTWTLPCAESVGAGQTVQIIDPQRYLSTRFLTIRPASSGCTKGTNTINGSSANIAQLTSPGSRAVLISDNNLNWSVTVIRQPERTLDFAGDFGGIPATAIGTTDCTISFVSPNWQASCPNTPLTSADTGDAFEAQAIGTGGTGSSNANTFVGTIGSVDTHAHTFNLVLGADTPTRGNSGLSVMDALFVCDNSQVPAGTCGSSPPPPNGGYGYKFGSTQTLPIGVAGDIPATGTPKLMTVYSAQLRSGGSGCTVGAGSGKPVTLQPGSASYPNALSGVQATFTGTFTGSAMATTLTAISATPTTAGLYRGIGSYTYDASGYYEGIPVVPNGYICSVAPTVDINFSVVTEVITSTTSNVYVTGSIPCNNDGSSGSPKAAQITTTTDHGTGLYLRCSVHKPLVSFGKDNQAAIEAVNDYEKAQNAAHAPACVKFSGRFLSSTVGAQHAITGAPCLEGDAQILSGIFIFPNDDLAHAIGDIFPIVDANTNGGGGPIQMQVVDPNHGLMSGAYITNLTFWGDGTSKYVQNAIKFYGFTNWATLTNLSSWNVRGCLICVGVDDPSPNPPQTPSGQIAESTFFNIRTERTGDLTSATPAFGLDGLGTLTNSPNNDLIMRYRAFDDNGVPLAVRPCVDTIKGGSAEIGHGAHELTFSELKVEESNMEYSPNATDAVQLGATTAECNSTQWTQLKSTPAYAVWTETIGQEAGVHGVGFVAPNIANPAVGTAAFHFKGCVTTDTDCGVGGDMTNVRLLGSLISDTNNQHGVGLQFDVGLSGNVVDIVQNSTSDYNLVYAGNVASGALEYDPHDQPTTAFITGSGYPVMTTLRCALGYVLTACDGANGQLVDTDSTQIITHKTLAAPVINASTINMSNLLMSPTAPTISSGFGTMPGITPNGTAAFQVTVGTGGTASTGVVQLPTAATGWACSVANVSHASQTRQTGSSMTSATFTNFTSGGAPTAWSVGDKLAISCQAF